MKKEMIALKFRWLFIALPLVITILMAIPLQKAKINPDLNAYLPADIPSKKAIEKLESVFGKSDPITLIFETDDILDDSTLIRIRNLTSGFKQSEYVKDIISIFTSRYIRGEGGSMMIDPVVKYIPGNRDEKEKLRFEIKDNPLVYKLIISDDFRYSLIILNPAVGFSDDEIFNRIRQMLRDFPGKEKVWLNGMSYLRDEIQKKATHDLAVLMPFGLIIMIFFLYFSFKEIKGVMLPLSVVIMTIVVAMGMMPLFGFELSLIAVLVPILMIAIANNYGVHIITRYQELNVRYPGRDMKTILEESLYYLRRPIYLTALTTIVGILGMVTHIMLPAKQMGIVCAIGIGFALLASIYYIPAVMAGLRKGKPNKSFTREKTTLADHFLKWSGIAVTMHPWFVITVFILVFIFSGTGIFWLKVSFNNEKMMPASHPLRVSTDIVNKHFGGTKMISLLFEGDIMNPEVMRTMDRYEKEMKKIPQVSNVFSLATVIRAMSRAVNDPDDHLYDAIPANRDVIAQYIEFYNMSVDPGEIEKLVSFDYTKANLTIQFRAEDVREFRTVEDAIDQLIRSSQFCTLKAGHCLVEKEMAESIVHGQNFSLIFAFLSIILLLLLIFRSLIAGIIGSIPLCFTLVCNFGLMGWAGLELDIATSLLSSIAIGLGVDFTIHLFWRLKTELSDGVEYRSAIRKTLKTTGRGIAINAFSVIVGFAVLFLSGLTILKAFGFLIIFSLILCLLCALLLIPAICLTVDPGFLQKSPILNFNKINGLK